MALSAILTRLRLRQNDQGTFGIFRVPELGFQVFSLELPWRDNRESVSCIPAGTYSVAWTHSPRFKRFTYQVLNVPGRSGVRIHSGVWAGDVSKGYATHVLGCIMLGLSTGYAPPKDKPPQAAILSSKSAIGDFHAALKERPFSLVIREV